jgi:uncharacterized membrane protein
MTTDRTDQPLSDQDRVLVVFAYLGPLGLVSLLASRREFVKWHAKQGLVLAATLVVAYPILRFVHFLLDSWFWQVFAELFWIGVWLTVAGIILTMLVCIIRGLEGERFRLPMLAEVADRL